MYTILYVNYISIKLDKRKDHCISVYFHCSPKSRQVSSSLSDPCFYSGILGDSVCSFLLPFKIFLTIEFTSLISFYHSTLDFICVTVILYLVVDSFISFYYAVFQSQLWMPWEERMWTVLMPLKSTGYCTDYLCTLEA